MDWSCTSGRRRGGGLRCKVDSRAPRVRLRAQLGSSRSYARRESRRHSRLRSYSILRPRPSAPGVCLAVQSGLDHAAGDGAWTKSLSLPPARRRVRCLGRPFAVWRAAARWRVLLSIHCPGPCRQRRNPFVAIRLHQPVWQDHYQLFNGSLRDPGAGLQPRIQGHRVVQVREQSAGDVFELSPLPPVSMDYWPHR